MTINDTVSKQVRISNKMLDNEGSFIKLKKGIQPSMHVHHRGDKYKISKACFVKLQPSLEKIKDSDYYEYYQKRTE